MTFTSDQYAQIAQRYDSAAADRLVPSDKREEFAKQAEWFRYLAAREAEELPKDTLDKKSSKPPSGSQKRLLTTLWLIGAGIYLIGTILFTNAIGLFNDRDRSSQVTEAIRPANPPVQSSGAADASKTGVSNLNVMTASERRHAISPEQPPYEAPELIQPSDITPAATKPLETGSASAAILPEMLRVAKTATIRNGPSSASKVIGTASPGAELQVRGRENDWIQFVDPSSGNSGWIQANSIEGASVTEQNGATSASTEIAPQVGEPKKKLVKERVKKKQSPADVVSSGKAVPKTARGYAGLPDDEAFFIDKGKRRTGIFARRRMLREGLMSRDFVPPR
jgi:hypothetical protein